MLENNEDPGTNLFKHLKNAKEKLNLSKLTVGNKTLHNTEDINAEFLKHFEEKFTDDKNEEETGTYTADMKQKIRNFFENNKINMPKISKVKREKLEKPYIEALVERAINEINSNSAGGPDNIHMKVVKKNEQNNT